MLNWTYTDLTNWIEQGCDTGVCLSVEFLDCSCCGLENFHFAS